MQKHIIDFTYSPDVVQSCISLVDDPYKTIVREDGSLNYLWEGDANQFEDGTTVPCGKRIINRQEANLAFRYRFLPRFSHRDTLITHGQEYGDAREALVTTSDTYEGTIFSWTIFAYQTKDGSRMDIIRYRLEARKGFGRAYSAVYLEELGDPASPSWTRKEGNDAYLLPNLQSKTPPPIVFATKGNGKELYEGEVREGAFALLYSGKLDEDSFTLEYAKKAEQWCHAYWQDIHPFLHTFRIPDKSVQQMVDAAGRNILQARETVDGIKEFHVGPTIYRGLWVVDGYYFGECAYMMGRDDEAFALLLAILRRQKPDGSIRILPDHHKETAVAISNIVRQCELHNDDERLKELWPTIVRGYEHLKKMSDASLKLPEDYPARGLFPPCFGDGGIYGPEAEYTTPMNVILGMRDAARAGKRLTLPKADAIEEFADNLMETMRKCIKRDTKLTEEGIPYLPLSMASTRTYRPQAGSATIARVAFHEEFAMDDPVVTNLLRLCDSLDDEEGIPWGTGWRSDESIYVYASVRFAQLFLAAGNEEKAVDYLYAFANHASRSRVWREEQPLKSTHSSDICGDMPHNWASVEFIRLVRNLVLLERNDGILLLPGLPDEWRPEKDNDLRFEQTPTKFGKIDLILKKTQTGFHLSYHREKGNQEPVFVLLHWKREIPSLQKAEGKAEWWKVEGDLEIDLS